VKTFAARYWREDDQWEVELVDDENVHTFASTLGRARRYIREATAAMYDLDTDQIDIEDHIELPGGLSDEVGVLLDHRAALEITARKVAEETSGLVVRILDSGVSVRDAGEIVHLSAQRVHQLAHKNPRRKRAPAHGGASMRVMGRTR
jgi:hypothetical protein